MNVEHWRESACFGVEYSMPVYRARARSPLFANDLDQYALAATSVELAIEDLLPGTEVEFARRNRHHDLPAHDLAFHMGISVVLADSVMAVARNGLMRREPFEPRFVVGVQPPLVVIDEH